MRRQSLLFRTLKAPADAEPAAGFYARVMARVETQPQPSVWSLFADSLFAKRLVYASAMFLVLLGTALVSSTPSGEEPYAAQGPEAILAGQQLPEPVTMMDPGRDREVMLANLATYTESEPESLAIPASYSQGYQ